MTEQMDEEMLEKYVATQYYKSSRQSLASGFAELASGAVNYGALSTDAYGLKVQAKAVEVQATQQANLLREEFIGAMGNALYGSTRRGVRASSNFIAGDIARSSEALGKDIDLTHRNAAMQARTLRAQSKIVKHRAQAQLVGTIANGVSSVAQSYKYYEKGNEHMKNAMKASQS